jgi:hypothetical protein
MLQVHRFDYARARERAPEVLVIARALASQPQYRSATVEELTLTEGERRRPLRVEDLEFLTFDEPVRDTTISMLPALASNRLLFCLNETCATTSTSDEGEQEQALRAFFEAVAFNYADPKAAANSVQTISGLDVDELRRRRALAYGPLLDQLKQRQFVKEGLRFALLQHWGPRDVASTMTRRAFSSTRSYAQLGVNVAPIDSRQDIAAFVTQLAGKLGLSSVAHAHWQFYLPTSLARANLLCALSMRREDALLLLGATYAMDIDYAAFIAFASEATRLLSISVDSPLPDCRTDDMGRSFDQTLARIREHCGEEGVRSLQAGFALGCEVTDSAFRDLAAQLNWLSNIDAFLTAASLLTTRIDMEWPDINRDTFIEPREMCSTTHVHDDHRLVTVETGDMIFWGHPDMELKLTVGDKVLIPAGRLHGSSVTSESCTYHQPIIPEQWVRDAFGLIRTQDTKNREYAR